MGKRGCPERCAPSQPPSTSWLSRESSMTLFLHNIGEVDGDLLISQNDALVTPSERSYDYVLANPPLGKTSSMSFTNEDGEAETDDLTFTRASESDYRRGPFVLALI